MLPFSSTVDLFLQKNLKDIRSIAPVARFFKMDEVTEDNEYRLFRNIYKDNYLSDRY